MQALGDGQGVSFHTFLNHISKAIHFKRSFSRRAFVTAAGGKVVAAPGTRC
jgi:hypothetical protein